MRRRYVGFGLVAEIEADADSERRNQREARKRQKHPNPNLDDDLPPADLEDAAFAAVDFILHSCLTAAGYHLHAGSEWRLKRA